MASIQLPAITITKGHQYDGAWRILSAYPAPKSPVDLSLWSGSFAIALNIGGDAIYSATPVLGVDGDVSVTIAADDTDALFSSAEIGGRVSLVFQLNLNAPDPAFDLVFQGGISVSGVIK